LPKYNRERPVCLQILGGPGRVARAFDLADTITTVGAPLLRFLQEPALSLPKGRVRCCGYYGLLCPADCIALTVRITCTLLPTRAINASRTARARDCFLSVFEQTRQRYRFCSGRLRRDSRRVPLTRRHPERPRFYQRAEGSRAHNAVRCGVATGRESGQTRRLVQSPDQWRWSSYRHYLLGETGPVKVNVDWGEISFRDRVA
jgi:hypothetical protein